MQAFVFESRYATASTEFKAETLVKKEVAIPSPGDGQLLVKVHAVGLNPVDYKIGSFGFVTFPIITGLDVAGVVTQVGPNVTKFKAGDRVHYMGNIRSPNGGFAEYALGEEITATPIPDSVSFEEAAALPTAGWTAYIALHRKVRVRSDETVLVTAGSGGVGGFAIQLAKLAGLQVITTCSAKNVEYVRKLGADHVIDYTSEDITARVKEITNGRGVDVWLDMLGSDSADQGIKNLAFGGSLVVIQGNPTTPLGDLFTKQQSVHDIFIGGAYQADKKAKEELALVGKALVELVKEKKIDPLVKEVVPFEDLPKALERIKERHVQGKIVAKIV